MYRHTGKQILKGNEHFGDGVNEEAAALIVEALNNFDHPLIHPDLAQPERESDYDWNPDESVDMSKFPMRHPHLNNDHEHHIARQSDEYACSCGKRWPVDEGEDHP